MKKLTSWLSALLVSLSMIGIAQAQFIPPKEGREFVRVSGAYTPPANKKIEVMEFFMYSCPHCYAIDPKINAWSKTLPKDVIFTRIPLGFNAGAKAQQQLYYTLLAMGNVNTYHSRVFTAMHSQRQALNTPAQITAWAKAQGIDEAKFKNTFNSFSVKNNMTRANKIAENFRIESVPTFIVAGKYLTSASMAGSEERALQVINYLITQARQGK